ncbi:MAG: class I mannose-6-phosphate isomerase [Butyrivibrio sp.]|nr:class I mannose-6-phosphate isomerase [Butyrivibrio sp.]
MAILKLAPVCKDYIWGGERLIKAYDKKYSGERLAETWEVSCHKDGPCTISEGEEQGKTLREYIRKKGSTVLGKDCEKFGDFPILIKFIDAKQNLSVQVHPTDEYATEHEGQNGKTEMWYISDCEKGAFLYYGFKRRVSKEELRKRIEDNTVLEVLNKVKVKKGDVFFIESGTIHAIGAGITVVEIQENSNVTYRVYDYGRRDKNGNERELHIDKALEVTNTDKMEDDRSFMPHIAKCKYFTVDKIFLDGNTLSSLKGKVLEDSFVSIVILEGEGTISQKKQLLKVKKGDSIFISAGSGDFEIRGALEGLLTKV